MTTPIPEPTAAHPRSDVDLRVVQEWLEALSGGACDEDAFLHAMHDITRTAPDSGWDLLSMVDQYYRRGRIKPEVFRNLKSYLEGQLLGTALDIEVSVPLPQREDTLAAAETIPIAATLANELSAAERDPLASFAMGREAATEGHGPEREIDVGDVLRDRYRIMSVLGRGGTGTVLEAVDQFRLDVPNGGQRVALKVLDSDVAERPELLNQLRLEFQHLQSLSHPNIVRVHEYDRDGDVAFFTMEYLNGLSLSRVLSARHQVALNRRHALIIIRDVGAALAYAHARDIVHGDLNPGNIFITHDGEVRVLDFGGSRTLHQGPRMSDFESSEQRPIATPRFASCQLLDGEAADMQDDLYAFACVIYVLMAGKHPFGELTAVQARSLHKTPKRPPGLTREQWRTLQRGLSFNRGQRPADVRALVKPFNLGERAQRLPVLLALLKVSPDDRVRGRLLPVLGAAALVLLVAGWWASKNLESVSRTAAVSNLEFQGVSADAQSSVKQWWRSVFGTREVPPSEAGKPAAIGVPAAGTPSVVPSAPRPPAAIAKATQPPALPATAPAAASASGSATASKPVSPSTSKSAVPVRPAAPPAAPSPVAVAPAVSARAPSAASTPSAPSGHSRIELADEAIDVPPSDPAARVVVRRKGNLRGVVNFTWWTESGTAKPGKDFVAVAAHQEQIDDGKATVNLFIPVVADTTRQQAKSFFVVISDPSPGATLGDRTVMKVSISAAE